MFSFQNEDESLEKAIIEATEQDESHPEITKDEDGLKRMIFIPKKIEEKVIERYHDDLREGSKVHC